MFAQGRMRRGAVRRRLGPTRPTGATVSEPPHEPEPPLPGKPEPPISPPQPPPTRPVPDPSRPDHDPIPPGDPPLNG